MKYKKFGNTGMIVSELCLGAMTFGGKGFWSNVGELKQDEVNKIVEGALTAGINFFDTANVYSLGESEKLLGQSLKDLNINRENIIIATKVAGLAGQGPNDSGLSRQHILNQIKLSLKRLKTDYIDLYQIHAYDPLTPLEETLNVLNDIVRSGLVRYIGCSNLSAWQIMKSRGISERLGLASFESVQAYYTIAGRDLEREVVPLLKDQKMGLLVWSPLAGGFLSGKFKRGQEGPENARRTTFDFPPINLDRAYNTIDVMEDISKQYQVSIARVALAWLLSKDYVTSVIIGVKSIEQLNDNIEATNLVLTQEEIIKLDEVSKLPDEYPGWMLARQQSMNSRIQYLK
jgi:aryl-alcohol dehydrogenase-like predicted oxidoreductase